MEEKTIDFKKEWYVVSTYSGHENAFKENLLRRIESMGTAENHLAEKIGRIVVAEKEVAALDKETGMPKTLKDGSPKMKKVNLFPGYCFVEVSMDDFVWYIIRNTPEATGFVGSSGKGAKPFPVRKEEIEPILKRMGIVDEEMFNRYSVGATVKVIGGPLEGTEGVIESINKETHTVVVTASFFGRESRVEVDFSEIEKI